MDKKQEVACPILSHSIAPESRDAASINVVSGEKESLGSDGNASVVSDSSSGADLAD